MTNIKLNKKGCGEILIGIKNLGEVRCGDNVLAFPYNEKTDSYSIEETTKIYLCEKCNEEQTKEKIVLEQRTNAQEIIQTKEDVIDHYFPKGDNRRGDALVVLAQAYIDGKKDSKNEFIKVLEGDWIKRRINKEKTKHEGRLDWSLHAQEKIKDEILKKIK
ncbi:MAG TPA: hypothetical protein VGB37_14605 [Candidatus Lokiarchaeia archaeon]